jgi:hypothetical protein
MADFDPTQRVIQYDSQELRRITSVIRKMGEEASAQARDATSSLTSYAVDQIKAAASSAPSPKQARRIAEGVRISKTSVTGTFGLGFASQKFSGGATTQLNNDTGSGKGILAGVEFGAKKLKNFPPRTPKYGLRGSRGYFIWPTLRRIQPEIIKRWEEAFSKIVKEWDN